MTGGKLLSTAEPFDIPALPPHAPVLTSKRSLVGAVIEAAQAGLLPSHPQRASSPLLLCVCLPSHALISLPSTDEEVAPKSPPQQLFLQSFLQSNIWPGMAGDRVKEIRRALHKSFKIKDYESLVACPPLPAALFEAARSFLAGAGMAPLSSMEQEPYNRFYTLHTTATGSDEDMEDSFVSDLSSAMNSARVSVVGVDGSDWDFPFGVHSTVEAAVAMHNVIEPPRPVSGDYDAMDLSFLPSPAFNNVSPSAALSGLALTL